MLFILLTELACKTANMQHVQDCPSMLHCCMYCRGGTAAVRQPGVCDASRLPTAAAPLQVHVTSTGLPCTGVNRFTTSHLQNSNCVPNSSIPALGSQPANTKCCSVLHCRMYHRGTAAAVCQPGVCIASRLPSSSSTAGACDIHRPSPHCSGWAQQAGAGTGRSCTGVWVRASLTKSK
jgi:hypothetical protein